MRFEVKLSDRLDVYALRIAGLETGPYHNRTMAVLLENLSLPTTVLCPFVLSRKPVEVRITILSCSRQAHLQIEVKNAAVGRKLRQTLTRYSIQNHGECVADREHRQLWTKIERILRRDKLSYNKLQDGATLTRRALESLMQLCDRTAPHEKDDVHDLAFYAAKSDRAFAARWLLKLFRTEPKLFTDQIGVRVFGLAVPEIGDDLVHLILDKHQGPERGDFCLALAKTKHSRAAEVIASVLNEERITLWALQALGMLKAVKYAKAVEKFLRHADADIRREAKKTLKKMGVPVAPSPPPLHLVKNRSSMPKGLCEWSSNLDFDDMEPALKRLAGCIGSGFGSPEIAEILGIAEEMKPDQTKAFHFSVRAQDRSSELWLIIFMDDVDSPDLEVHGDPRLIQRFESAMSP